MRHLRHLLPLLTLVLGLLSPSLKAQGTAEKKTPPTHPLTLTVDGIIEPKGELLIAIYSSAESYPQSSNNAPADYGLPSFKDILFTFKAGDIQYITLR